MLTVAFSIVIPSKNEEKDIGILLKSITSQTIRPEEIILADKSSDSTREIARSYGITIVDGVDDGRVGKARNIGAANVNTDYLIFLDADTHLPTVTFLEDAVTCMECLDLDLASVYYRPVEKTWKSAIIFFFMNAAKKIDSFFKAGIATGGAGMIFRTKTFRKLGGFNEQYKISEDIEITRRTVKEGYTYSVLPLYLNVSTRRFSQTPVKTILKTIIGGAGTIGANAFHIPFLSKFIDTFEEWYGETGGDTEN
jgi:glycosyltransferase involved in cell wall biosynthesis